jgi:Ku protein
MDMVAIGRVVLTSREHIIALEPLDNGLMGTLLRYPYEVRDEKEYFDEIQDVKVTKDMLDLAKHIVTRKIGEFEPDKFEDHYEAALAELINAKRNGKTVGPKPRPRGLESLFVERPVNGRRPIPKRVGFARQELSFHNLFHSRARRPVNLSAHCHA